MDWTQDNRNIAVDTPLGKDALLLERFTLVEGLNRPFLLDLDMRSAKPNLDPRSLPGQSVTVRIELPAGGQRYINGFVRTCEKVTQDMDLASYKARVVPWFSLLQLSSNCKIFQKLAVPDIIKQVFSNSGFSDYRFNLRSTYTERGVCTQYRETHFNFLSRLMEEEGISYHFEHENGKHTMVFTDQPSAFRATTGYSSLPFLPQKDGQEDIERIESWHTTANIETATVALTDYDYTAPRTDLAVSAQTGVGLPQTLGELFDAPGDYYQSAEGETRARVRAEEIGARRITFQGRACCLGLASGTRFSLEGTPGKADDAEYIITTMTLTATSAEYRTAGPNLSDYQCACSVEAVPSSTTIRPPRVTPKPVIPGLQTAVVTGPQGYNPKIPYVTALGSIKVQFRWDRHGNEDDESSGWIRVAQILAGNQYGAMFVPRIGNEVVVAFEEGDPDRPLIVGSVYNGVALPTLPLPHFAQRCYFHDDGGNALCFTPENNCQSIVMFSPYKNTIRVVGASDEAGYTHIPNQPQYP